MGSTSIQTPSVPAAPSTTSSIADWVKNYPAVFALQQQYAPQEAAQQVALAQQYAGPLGQAYKSAQEAMYPEEAALSKELTGTAQQYMTGELTPEERDMYLSDLRSNLGANIGSPIAADYTSRGLLGQREEKKRYGQNLGLSITGRQPIAQANAPATSNYTAGFTPGSVMNYNMSGYSPYVSAYTNMYNANAQMSMQSPPWASALAGIGGSVAGGIGAGWTNKFF